jgi:hypothetical protein
LCKNAGWGNVVPKTLSWTFDTNKATWPTLGRRCSNNQRSQSWKVLERCGRRDLPPREWQEMPLTAQPTQTFLETPDFCVEGVDFTWRKQTDCHVGMPEYYNCQPFLITADIHSHSARSWGSHLRRP